MAIWFSITGRQLPALVMGAAIKHNLVEIVLGRSCLFRQGTE